MKTLLENLSKYWVTPIIAIVGGLLGLYFSVVKNNMEKQATNLQNTALRIETQLKEREFDNNLKLNMYTEVKDAITNGDSKVQSAVLLIVNELLADDSVFRDKLIDLLRASPNTNETVKAEIHKIERTETAFYAEQTQKSDHPFTIDIFYMEDLMNESMPRAKQVNDVLSSAYPDYQIRLRLLPKSINARSGYHVDANEIRYDAEEEEVAQKCLELIKSKKIFSIEQPRLHLVKHATPNYMSVFVRNM